MEQYTIQIYLKQSIKTLHEILRFTDYYYKNLVWRKQRKTKMAEINLSPPPVRRGATDSLRTGLFPSQFFRHQTREFFT